GDTEAWRAAGAEAEARTLVARLESARFVRGTGSPEDSLLETYHDRIRETVVASLRPEPLREHHRQLALVLEQSDRCDPEEVAGHFEGAGELPKAGSYYGQAADRAMTAVAFDHAAMLYRKALNLHPGGEAERRELCSKLANALANGGRGAEAGPAYLVAAEGAKEADVFDLRLRAADQFLLGGLVKDGVQLFETLL